MRFARRRVRIILPQAYVSDSSDMSDMSDDTPTVKGARAVVAYAAALRAVELL